MDRQKAEGKGWIPAYAGMTKIGIPRLNHCHSNEWYFGLKAHIGADVDSGLVHTVVTTAANESGVSQIGALLHGKEDVVHSDSGYRGAQCYVTRAERIEWKIARRRFEVEKIRRARECVRARRAEKRNAQIRARVEHPFRIVKCVFGCVKVRFKGRAKKTAQVVTQFCVVESLPCTKALVSDDRTTASAGGAKGGKRDRIRENRSKNLANFNALSNHSVRYAVCEVDQRFPWIAGHTSSAATRFRSR